MKKLVITLIVVLLCISVLNCIVLGASSNRNVNLNNFDNRNAGKFENLTSKSSATIISILRIAAASVGVVILLVISMKYMISAPGDRADLKKHIVGYVVGAVICFGTSGILKLISEFTTDALKQT